MSETAATLTSLDWVIIAILALSAGIGLIRGLVRELLSLLAWVVSVWVAVLYSGRVADWLTPYVEVPELRMVIAVAATFMISLLVISLAGALVYKMMRMAGIGGSDRSLGGLFGVLRGGIIIALLILAIDFSPARGEPWMTDSRIVPWIRPYIEWLPRWMATEFDDLRIPGTIAPSDPGGTSS